MLLLWLKMLRKSLMNSNIPLSFFPKLKQKLDVLHTVCHTCLAVQLPPELSILGRFLLTPGSVRLGRGARLGGGSERLS